MSVLSPTDWVTLAAAAMGAALGSVLAFSLEALRQWRKERALRYAALMQAQFVLGMQLKTLMSIWDQHLAAAEVEPDRFSALPVLRYHAPDVRVDFAALAFVAAMNRVDSLRKVHTAQEAFLGALDALDIRNQSIARVLSLAGAPEQLDADTGVCKITVDPRWAVILKAETNGLYDTFNAAIDVESRALQELAEVSKGLFPRKPTASIDRLAVLEPPPS